MKEQELEQAQRENQNVRGQLAASNRQLAVSDNTNRTLQEENTQLSEQNRDYKSQIQTHIQHIQHLEQLLLMRSQQSARARSPY